MTGDAQMTVRNLVYFDRWMDPVGADIIAATEGVALHRLSFDDAPEIAWRALATAHGYQMLPSTETPREFHPSRAFLQRCPELLCISTSGAGYDMADVATCTEAGVLVINQGGANAESVAQHTIGMMLVLCKRIVQSDNAVRRPERHWTRFDYSGHELTGRTLGIVGLGNIGRRLADVAAHAFGMQVIAYDPYITRQDFRERHAEPADLGVLLRQSDFVSLHCPLTDETRGMIGAEAFSSMKPTAFFFNTARGGIHDEAALAKALAAGRLTGAGLDVFDREPPGHDHPLLRFDNVIVSPHNAGVSSDSLYNMAEWAALQWLDVFKGLRPSRLVNPEAWERYAERYARILGEHICG